MGKNFFVEKPLVNKEYQLERFAAKGGWTYVTIPEILQNKNAPFGWVKVRGSIDGYEFKNYHLMPMGNGKLFLPVKAEIRKQIGKREGDWVKVTLFADTTALEIPGELLACLSNEPLARKIFLDFTEGEQKAYIDWIYSAKREETRVERIAKTLRKVSKGQKFMDKEL